MRKRIKGCTRWAIKTIGLFALLGGVVASMSRLLFGSVMDGWTNVVILAFSLGGFLFAQRWVLRERLQKLSGWIWLLLVGFAALGFPVTRGHLPAWLLGQDPVGAQWVAIAVTFGLIAEIVLYEIKTPRNPTRAAVRDTLFTLPFLIPILLTVQ